MAAAGIASPFPIDDLVDHRSQHDPAPPADDLAAHPRNERTPLSPPGPDAVVIIDSPDFTHRIARRVRARAPSIPIIDYVSPSVWAWRSGRARAMRAYVDCVLAILPFEPAAHLRLGGPPCIYVGHPLTRAAFRAASRVPTKRVRRRADPPFVLVLPGSRSSEIRRLLVDFRRSALARVSARIGPMELVLPTVPHLVAQVRAGVAGWAVKPRIVVDAGRKWAAFRTARVALAASGTVTLELALAGVPTVAAYKVTLVEETDRAARGPAAARLRSVILANLVIGENVVPEFLQRDCTPQRLADALTPLFSDTPERLRQIDAFARLDRIMAVETCAPSAKAASIVLDIARRGRRDPASPRLGLKLTACCRRRAMQCPNHPAIWKRS